MPRPSRKAIRKAGTATDTSTGWVSWALKPTATGLGSPGSSADARSSVTEPLSPPVPP